MERNTSHKTMDEMNKLQTNKLRQSLNKLIQQDVKMKTALSDASSSLKNWQTHELALTNSNNKLKMELKNLQTEDANLTQLIADKTESHLRLDEMFRKYEESDNERDEQFWKFFSGETERYKYLFTNAEHEYDTISLKKDIERYHEMSSDVAKEIIKTDQDMVELTSHYGLIEMNTNEKAKCLEDLQEFQGILMDYDKSTTLAIRSAENKMQELSSKIRQKRREIEDIPKKIQQQFNNKNKSVN